MRPFQAHLPHPLLTHYRRLLLWRRTRSESKSRILVGVMLSDPSARFSDIGYLLPRVSSPTVGPIGYGTSRSSKIQNPKHHDILHKTMMLLASKPKYQRSTAPSSFFILTVLFLLVSPNHVVVSLSEQPLSRRDALVQTAAATGVSLVAGGGVPPTAWAEESASALSPPNPLLKSTVAKIPPSIVPLKDPPPLLALARSGIDGKQQQQSSLKIPRVGYSLYKTAGDQASRCTALALQSGIRHFDVATQYGSNAQVGTVLSQYCNKGLSGLDVGGEKPELLALLESTSNRGYQHAYESTTSVTSSNSGIDATKAWLAPPPEGSAGRRGRRESLFVSHKLANSEQSTDKVSVRRAVKAAIATLGVGYLDLVSLHSPLTTPRQRLATYEALLELRDSGFVKSVGVCNYGLGPLQEIEQVGLDLPSINQLELSPFHTHAPVLDWCNKRTIAIGCGAWSKLSSQTGPQEEWSKLGDIAKAKGMTKAQVLVRWSLQKGYVCVPRSASTSKLERVAIAENSYGGVNQNNRKDDTATAAAGSSPILTEEEMNMIDTFNTNFKAGQLGRRDGWEDEDVTGPTWDPTEIV